MGLSGLVFNISHISVKKRFIFNIHIVHCMCADWWSADQGFCRRNWKGEQPRTHDRNPILEGQVWKSWIIVWSGIYSIFSSECNHPNSLFQMKLNTTKKMASILNITDSAYYPSFKYGRKIKMHFHLFIHVNCILGQCSEMFSLH